MKIVVSACLLGKNCKYNGGNNYSKEVAEFVKDKEIIEICPEMLAGMPAPRPCVEIAGGKAVNQFGADVDGIYRKGVETAMQQIRGQDVALAILKSKSPTCGVKQIYDGSFSGKLVDGKGIFAEALINEGYSVIEADDLMRRKKMDKQQYVCPKCGNTRYETDQFQATGGNFAKVFDIQNKKFITISCTNCGYTELYRSQTKSGWNVLDFLMG